jgi:hypothetical protein
METFLSFLYGASMKIADELMDVPNDYNNLKVFFQLLTVSTHSILGYSDYLFSFIFIFITVGCYYAGSLDDPIWINFGYLILFIFIISIINNYDKIKLINMDLGIIILFIAFISFIGSATDNYFLPSEYNISKFLVSMVYLFGLIVAYGIILYFENDYELKTVKKVFVFGIGYILIRTIVKGYLYFNSGINNAEIEIPKEETL